MKRIVKILLLILILIFLSASKVYASPVDDLGVVSGAYSLGDALPEESKEAIEKLGLKNNDFLSIQCMSFDKILNYLTETLCKEAGEVTPSLCVVLAVLFIYSIFNGVFDSCSSSALSSVLSVVSSLCLACCLLLPVTKLIDSAQHAIETSSDFMLAYIPVMAAVLVSAGQTALGSGYSAMMIVAAEGVAQIFSKVISPMLGMFLSLGITTSVVPEIKLSGILGLFSKTVKWIMAFVFSMFTALLSLKSLFSSSVDNVSSKAVRYTMSSFVPVVGGALSEAYRTINGSLVVLKSGIGVFVIISIVTVFIPIIFRLLIWMFTINLCKSFAEAISINNAVALISSVITVLSLILSVIFCIVTLFIISTALIITIGGTN